MHALRRLVLVLGLAAANAVLLCYLDLSRDMALAALAHLPVADFLRTPLAGIVGRVGLLAAELLPLWVWRSLRDVGTLRLRWSWTLLLPVTIVFLEFLGWQGWPEEHAQAVVQLSFWTSLLIGANEEVIFHGYAFRQQPGRHPRLVVVSTSVVFGLIHYVNLTHDSSFQGISGQVGLAFVVGLSLGIVRLASGSLGWCILLHGLTDVGADLAGPHFLNLTAAILILPSLLIVIGLLLWKHPALQPLGSTSHPVPGRPPGSSLTKRLRLAKLVLVGLFGVAGGLAAVFVVLVPRYAPSPGDVLGLRLFFAGWVALPCWILAVGILLRRPDGPPQPPVAVEAAPLARNRQTVKIAATALVYVTALIGLVLLQVAFVKSADLLNWLAPWAHAWKHRGELGVAWCALLGSPLLLAFCLAAAIRPLPPRWALGGWSASVGYHALGVWLFATRVHASYDEFGFRVPFWGLAGFGLVLSLYLLLRPWLPVRPLSFLLTPTPPSAMPGH